MSADYPTHYLNGPNTPCSVTQSTRSLVHGARFGFDNAEANPNGWETREDRHWTMLVCGARLNLPGDDVARLPSSDTDSRDILRFRVPRCASESAHSAHSFISLSLHSLSLRSLSPSFISFAHSSIFNLLVHSIHHHSPSLVVHCACQLYLACHARTPQPRMNDATD